MFETKGKSKECWDRDHIYCKSSSITVWKSIDLSLTIFVINPTDCLLKCLSIYNRQTCSCPLRLPQHIWDIWGPSYLKQILPANRESELWWGTLSLEGLQTPWGGPYVLPAPAKMSRENLYHEATCLTFNTKCSNLVILFPPPPAVGTHVHVFPHCGFFQQIHSPTCLSGVTFWQERKEIHAPCNLIVKIPHRAVLIFHWVMYCGAVRPFLSKVLLYLTMYLQTAV